MKTRGIKISKYAHSIKDDEQKILLNQKSYFALETTNFSFASICVTLPNTVFIELDSSLN